MTKSNTDKRCPHCNYKLIGTEIFRDTCPKCQRPLKKVNSNNKKNEAASESNSISFGETQIAASVPLSFDEGPGQRRQEHHNQTPRAVYNQNTSGTFTNPLPPNNPPLPLGSVPSMVIEPISSPSYKVPFMASLVGNAVLLLLVGFLTILLITSGEEKVSISHSDNGQQAQAIAIVTNTDENSANGVDNIENQDMDNAENSNSGEDDSNALALASPQAYKTKKSAPVPQQNAIVIPKKIEGPTPNPMQVVDQTGSIGKIMVSSVPVAPVTINGKKAGYTPGLRATLPNHNGLILIGDNSTPFSLRFLYQEVDGKLTYEVSSHPDCFVLFNGVALGRTPQEAKSKGGNDSFTFELPGTDQKMKVVFRYTAE